MDFQQAHLDSLNKVISVQNELIAFLKAEIERLKLSQVVYSPVITPGSPAPQQQWPNTYPWVPGQQPYNPLNPYVVTCTKPSSDLPNVTIGDPPGTTSSGSTTVFTGGALPNGSIQCRNGVSNNASLRPEEHYST